MIDNAKNTAMKKREVVKKEQDKEEVMPELEGKLKFLKNKMQKGYRTAKCPACGATFTAKYIREVIACTRCGYRKTEGQVK